MQRILRADGYVGADGQPIVVDEDFGTNSDFALRAYQRDHGLDADGWCGRLTWGVMFGDNG